MSLINKMLQDLDARGGDGARGGAASEVRPVSYGGRSGLSPAIGAGVVALAVLGGGGYAAWKYFRGGQQPVSTVAGPRVPQSVPAQDGARQAGSVAAGEKLADRMEQRNAEARGAAAAPGAVAVARQGRPAAHADAPKRAEYLGDPALNDTMSRSAQAGSPAEAGAPRRALRAGDGDPAQADTLRRAVRAGGTAWDTEARRVDAAAPVAGSSAAPLRERAMAKRMAAARGTTPASAPATVVQADGGEAGLSSQQKAENEYRRALAKLQDARVSEALASLEQAVYLYPRHDAARQTLVSLLIEAGRTPDAIRHLTFATRLDPRQANMTMLLARLQLENGGNALDTLQRSLPYAESNADYRALMAGVLQRANRHKEAAEHYQAALRLQPSNAVWWMGLGISLQADKRNAEAKTAFQHARDSGRLAPELQGFVERRLQQLN